MSWGIRSSHRSCIAAASTAGEITSRLVPSASAVAAWVDTRHLGTLHDQPQIFLARPPCPRSGTKQGNTTDTAAGSELALTTPFVGRKTELPLITESSFHPVNPLVLAPRLVGRSAVAWANRNRAGPCCHRRRLFKLITSGLRLVGSVLGNRIWISNWIAHDATSFATASRSLMISALRSQQSIRSLACWLV